MKKIISSAIAALLLITALTGCGAGGFEPANDITVISREEGSGTRGAFIELFGVEEKDADGKKIDKTIDTADINDSTGLVLTAVASNQNSIGYVSLGAMNDTVKALKIDGVEATVENIKSGTYKISRPFNIAAKAGMSDVAQDFVDFILSADGQAVIVDKGYIAVSEAAAYAGIKPSGKIVVAGSSSVSPIMEKLREAYLLVNTNATVEIQQSDSTTGMNSAIEGICDIGMASRELKDSELEAGLIPTVIAQDGLAVIVHTANTAENLSVQQVKDIYTGVSTKWSEVIG
ncbi:MAG: substrate-binding domain-containing protein [Eubacteriales bacterium]